MANDINNLKKATKNKADEFYTQMEDIQKEVALYKEYFKDKVVLCNCDDPFESHFFKYFALNFNKLGLKKLITTCYAGSPIITEQLSLFDVKGLVIKKEEEKKPYKIEITEVEDTNGDGAVDLSDVEYLIKNKKNTLTLLKGDGDFRSDECIELLKQADIVVTNPPFSLFREYVAQLMEYDKKFLIIGNQNAITYKEIFPLLKNNNMWLGITMNGSNRYFRVPDSYPLTEATGKVENGIKYAFVKGVRWFTNLDNKQRNEEIVLYKKYSPEIYPKYDNYDAINVDKVTDIPKDYDGVIGVPITFFGKYNPKQFEILGLAGKDGFGLKSTKTYNEYKEIRQNGEFTGSSGGKTNGNPVMRGKPTKGNYFIREDGECVYSLFARIFIQIKKGDAEND